MVSSNVGGQDWSMDTSGKVRMGKFKPKEVARASGWVDAKGHIGGVESIDGEVATVDTLPCEVLDLLEQRFPGTRWFVGEARSSSAA
ncbi:MAG: hypothetical protein ACI89L_001638 [Phycisphaerales bacterium]|jgi:hypothetical protein